MNEFSGLIVGDMIPSLDGVPVTIGSVGAASGCGLFSGIGTSMLSAMWFSLK
jgi:hypothetical protein